MDKDVSQSLFYSHDYVINVIVQAFDKIVFKGESETHLKVTSMESAFWKMLNRHFHIFIDQELEITSILSHGKFLNKKLPRCQRFALFRKSIVQEKLK